MARVIVVGAGVSGLSAAHRLRTLGHTVTVLEAEDHVGGKTAAHRRDGFTLNSGATVLGASYSSMRAIARELGIESQIIPVAPTVGVFADGRVHWLRGAPPGALIDFVKTPLLSTRSKLLLARAGLDAFRARRKAGYDQPQLRAELDTESVGEYCARRLNDEIRDRLLAPLMGGLFVVDGATVSVASLFFSLVKFLGGGMLGYRGGIDFFARALADTLDVRTTARVTLVERTDTGARVRWTEDGASRDEAVDGVVLSVAAPLVPPLYPGLDPRLQGILLEGLKQANYISLRVALKRRPEADALLVVVPFGALGGIGTVMYEHNISPSCAPPGSGVVGALLYHEWVTPRLSLSDDELISEVLGDLDRIVPGIAGDVEFAQLTRWAPAALLGDPGTHRLIAEIDRLIDPGDRVQLAGDYLSIPSIEGSVVTGEAAARRLAGALGH
ncbi:MAG TPA: FAD-dependent oxidoreductase [Solirubrobacteraceae bacterium]|nr:FAD-dependent oxidoreductase [Solirubrobacteraceae bacterium]